MKNVVLNHKGMNLKFQVEKVRVINPNTGTLVDFTTDELLEEENAFILQEILDGLPEKPCTKKTGEKSVKQGPNGKPIIEYKYTLRLGNLFEVVDDSALKGKAKPKVITLGEVPSEVEEEEPAETKA
ncbi:MAG: hypothetical protein AAF655_12075 [Bacteroidota bacterium]